MRKTREIPHTVKFAPPTAREINVYNFTTRITILARAKADVFPQPYTTGPRAGQWLAERARRRAAVRKAMESAQ